MRLPILFLVEGKRMGTGETGVDADILDLSHWKAIPICKILAQPHAADTPLRRRLSVLHEYVRISSGSTWVVARSRTAGLRNCRPYDPTFDIKLQPQCGMSCKIGFLPPEISQSCHLAGRDLNRLAVAGPRRSCFSQRRQGQMRRSDVFISSVVLRTAFCHAKNTPPLFLDY